VTFLCNKLAFYDEESLVPRPITQAGEPPLVGCPRLLIHYIHNFRPYLEDVPVRNPQTRAYITWAAFSHVCQNWSLTLREHWLGTFENRVLTRIFGC